MNQAIIAVGSNIDPDKNIGTALEEIRKHLALQAESSFIRTKPIGNLEQPDFLNGALLVETKKLYSELKNWLKQVEIKLGRNRNDGKYGPRTIDLDIVVWNHDIVDNNVYEREFLKKAVFELLPDLK